MPALENLTLLVEDYGYVAVFVGMFFEGMCIPVPSELVMGFAGYLVYQGKFSLTGAILSGWLGSFAGSCTIYYAARKGGRHFLYRYCHLLRLSPARLDTIGEWFHRFGPPFIIPWRQVPVLRTKISIAAGLLDLKPLVFALYTAVGIAVWCTLSVSLGYYFGQNWMLFVDFFARLGTFVAAAIAVLAVVGVGGLFLYLRRRRKLKEQGR
ncbi:DedA family protein [Anaeroselena agilis]|uniref:DedA family protein n=1 Tax=Anaeroselena agilis TaxID=3063788 RepID=A0ABU3P0R8_9FIRM|nr:DedA family protein [Selenomonadales bacterium 4137-cl]